jgi:Ca2+/H+ antiporter
MSLPAFNGLIAAVLLFSLLAGIVGLTLDRAVRAPGLSAAIMAVLIFGLSWGGLLLLGE